MYVRIHTCITVSLLLKLGYVDVVVALQQLLNCFVLVAAAVCWKKHRNYKITSGNGSKLLAQLILSSSPRALSAGQVQLSLFFI